MIEKINEFQTLKFVCGDAVVRPGDLRGGFGCYFETAGGEKIDFIAADIQIRCRDIIRATIEVPLCWIENTPVAGELIGRDHRGNQYDMRLRDPRDPADLPPDELGKEIRVYPRDGNRAAVPMETIFSERNSWR